jgi:hypothetical protein
MAVTLTNTDLIAPGGLLMAQMFPLNGASLTTFVDDWIAQATTAVSSVDGADQDTAATAWVYWRGFTQAANELATQPSSVKTGTQAQTWNASQIERLESLAAQYKSIYDAYAETSDVTTSAHSLQASVVRDW